MNDLFQTLINTIKYRFSSIITRLRTLTNPIYIKNRIWGYIRQFFISMFDVRPKDKNDYYTVFGWMFSKRLAYMLVMVIGVAGCAFLYSNRENVFKTGDDDGIKTYNYNSVFLRLVKGQVRIKGKGGYLAYEGDVNKGKVTGSGVLYDSDENMVYSGNFVNNEYSGTGTRYFNNGNVWYEGSFLKNNFQGKGTEYRENGTKLYEGDFVDNLKQGTGTLYDNGDNPIFKGSFFMDEIQYSSLLGKETAQIGDSYSGEQVFYEASDVFDVYLSSIDALYESKTNENALDDSMKVETVYVLKNEFPSKNGKLNTIKELRSYFGKPRYEGYSDATPTELLCISFVRENSGDKYYDSSNIQFSNIYDDYISIDNYKDMTVYLYSFEQGGLRYTFVTKDREQLFGFYYIDSIAESGEAKDENKAS